MKDKKRCCFRCANCHTPWSFFNQTRCAFLARLWRFRHVQRHARAIAHLICGSLILLLLDTKSWPKDDFVSFGNRETNKLTEHYMALLKKKNGYDIIKISSKWTCLKTYIFLMLHNSPNEFYLEIWHQIFINNEVMAECQNMHIFEILMIVSFTTP